MLAIGDTKLFWTLHPNRRPLSDRSIAKTTPIWDFFSRFSGQMYQVPYRILQKYCLVFTFKPPLIHLELQNTPQTLSGCITREYYRFWEFQHDRSTRTGLTVIKLHLLDFAPEPREICTILSCNPLDPLKSRRSDFITVSPVLVLRLCWNSQKRYRALSFN